MTKVLIDESFLTYQRELVGDISEAIKENSIEGVNIYPPEEPVLFQPTFVLPPQIKLLDLELFDGNMGGLIQIYSRGLELFNVHVIIRDEYGNLIEKGDADEAIDCPGLWGYVTTVSIPSRTALNIYVAAIDCVDGVGAASVGLGIL